MTVGAAVAETHLGRLSGNVRQQGSEESGAGDRGAGRRGAPNVQGILTEAEDKNLKASLRRYHFSS